MAALLLALLPFSVLGLGEGNSTEERLDPPPPWELIRYGELLPAGSDSIFVSIAAYADDEVDPTVQDLLDKAFDPSRVTFGIMLQDKPKRLAKGYPFMKRPDFQGGIIKLDISLARGTCWARYIIQQELFKDEDYYMQLDAHHRVIQDWDKIFLEWLGQCREKSPKPILSIYANAFNPTSVVRPGIPLGDCYDKCDQRSGPCDWCKGKCCRINFNGGENGCLVTEGGIDNHECVGEDPEEEESEEEEAPPRREVILNSNHIGRLSAMKYYETGKLRILPSVVNNFMQLDSPQLSIPLISGHFIFVERKWVEEVPYDPHFIFEGEEDSLGVRSYTHGWDIYYPHRPSVWHFYYKPNSPTYQMSWLEKNRNDARLRALVGSPGEPWPTYPPDYDWGPYGLGTERTMADFARASGIFWNKRFLHEKAFNGDASIVISDQEVADINNSTGWQITRCCKMHTRELCFEKGCRWVDKYPGPYCQFTDQPLKDCGHPGVTKAGCAYLGCVWTPESPGPPCQYGIPEFPPGYNHSHSEL
eukprot:gb/GEZN01003535.1/.p1 GENE.gb/GEZN01003535.1/~~gb/GEZN01003535.1/.p1  ORF type:complete len:539 (-),score=74.83 gb/GEZN01003535.1/:534-2126(-)